MQVKNRILQTVLAIELVVITGLALAFTAPAAEAEQAKCNNKPSTAEMGKCDNEGQPSACRNSTTMYCFYNNNNNCYDGECTGN